MASTPKARVETWARHILVSKYDELYALYIAQQSQLNTLSQANTELQARVDEQEKTIDEQQNEHLCDTAEIQKLQNRVDGHQNTVPQHPSKLDSFDPETTPEVVADLLSAQDVLHAQIWQRDSQLGMQGDTIRNLESRVKELEDQVAELKAEIAERDRLESNTFKMNDGCEKKCDEMRKRLCRLVKAIDIHGRAVKDVAMEATQGLDCEETEEDEGRQGRHG